jgi:phage-related protein (TIGR01555 family)
VANQPRDPADTPADPLDGYKPQRLDSTAPQLDPAVQAAAHVDAEREQTRRKTRWDAATIDAFVNGLTGLGDPSQDKLLGGINGALKFIVTFLAGTECEDRWRGSDLGGRVVEQVPAEMTRMGFEVAVQPDDDEGLDEEGGAEAAAIERVDAAAASSARRRDTYARDLARRIAARKRARTDWPDDPGAEGAPPAPKPAPDPAELPYVDEEGQAIVEEIEAQLRDLDALGKFREALEYERAYGGAAILLGVDDGVQNDLTVPLRLDQLAEVKHLTVFRGGWDGELIAWRYYADPRKANYGMPEVYMLRNLGVPISSPPAPGEGKGVGNAPPIPAGDYSSLVYFVHESRVLPFPGKAVSRRARVQMRGWGDSVFMRVDEVLSQYSQTWQAIASIMVEWSMGVLKMEGLADMFSAQGDPMAGPSGGTGPAPSTGLEVLMGRIRAINLGKSNAHTFLIDGNEEFKRETSPLSGLAEVLESFMLRLAAAVDMPVSLLMGQSPGGLRAGDDDVRFFYDRIMSKISSNLIPLWRRLIILLFVSKRTSPTAGKEPRKWSVSPRPLRQLNEKETAEVRKLTMETDIGYIGVGVQSPAETTSSRFGGSKWSAETTIDFDGRAIAARRKALAAAGDPSKPGAGGGSGSLTPSAVSQIITVNEARAMEGYGPWPDEAEGKLTVAEFQAKRAAIAATVANAELGKVGTPPPATDPKPAPMPLGPGAAPPHQLGPGEKAPPPHPSSFGAPNEPPKKESPPAAAEPKPPIPPAKGEPEKP